MKKLFVSVFSLVLVASCSHKNDIVGNTSVTLWPDGKKSAISITYDDGTINQFTVARPIMNEVGFPGTFYILTGKIEGSAKGKFIGRPLQKIIDESVTVSTNEQNFFERASAIAYTGSTEAVDYHTRAGALFEAGKVQEAYELIDEGYAKLRSGELILKKEINYHDNETDTTTWEDLKTYAAEGHEIASHTITHPRLAVLDEQNLLYELEQSKADIRKFLGPEYTFSAECPYGTEDERVMDYAYDVYPALRNRMPAYYLEELNRSNKTFPGSSKKEYVQWQRGPLTDVSMDVMKSWVDTCLSHKNIWLVLVFHGIDGIGWEPRTGNELKEYFSYIKEKEKDIWVATFADVTKYIRLRKSVVIDSQWNNDEIDVNITTVMDTEVYNVPLTMKTYIPSEWRRVILESDNSTHSGDLKILKDDKGSYVLYDHPSQEWNYVLKEGF